MINKKQKVICIIATVIITASCLFLTPSKIAYAATSGDFEYKINPDGTSVTITDYKGANKNLIIPATLDGMDVTAIKGLNFNATIETVIIEEGIAEFDSFNDCANLRSITIPSTVSNIEVMPFFGCNNLQSINVVEANTYFTTVDGVLLNKSKNIIFRYPPAKSGNYTIPLTVNGIDSWAFYGSKNITHVYISKNVNSIGNNAFDSCKNIISFEVDALNPRYSSQDGVLFDRDKSTLIQCPQTKSGHYGIPNTVNTIGYRAFSGCAALTGITIHDGVSTIEAAAFAKCSGLQDISLPSNITEIGYSTFWECTNLTNIDLPDYLEVIGDGAFSACTSLVSIDIPDKVTSIGNGAFQECSNLNSFVCPANCEIIDAGAFWYCTSLSSFILNDGITTIEFMAFYGCSGLRKIIIPNTIQTIGESAFERCLNLGKVYYLGNAPTLGTDVFNDCKSGLTMFYLKGATGFTNPWYGYPTKELASIPAVSYQTHVQNVGWQGWKTNGEVAGTSGQSLRLEGMNIEIDGMPDSVEYRTHVQDIGWQGWVRDGEMTGTSGRALRLEAIEIRLTGYMAANYDIYYRVHAQNIGWMDWAKNGQSAGTAGLSYRLEAIQIQLVPKGGAAPGSTAVPFRDANGPVPTNPNPIEPEPTKPTSDVPIKYQTHVQNIGWQGWKSSGEAAGTSGQSLRLEGMYIDVEGADNAVEYRTHVQNIGWQGWVNEGEMTGTSGRSLRLEAIEIRLKGDMAVNYDIYYRVHAQNIGWMDWAKNGQSAGTAGLSYRLEAIQIQLVPKGGAAPGSTAVPFRNANGPVPTNPNPIEPEPTNPTSDVPVKYQTHVQNIGWQGWKTSGEAAGTSGQSLRLEGMYIDVEGADNAVEYRTHVQNIGWQGWVNEGEMTGTAGAL